MAIIATGVSMSQNTCHSAQPVCFKCTSGILQMGSHASLILRHRQRRRKVVCKIYKRPPDTPLHHARSRGRAADTYTARRVPTDASTVVQYTRHSINSDDSDTQWHVDKIRGTIEFRWGARDGRAYTLQNTRPVSGMR